LPLIVGDTGHQDISYLNQGNIVILARDRIAPAPLAAAIAGVIEHPDRRREMAQAARRVADQHLNWDRLIERTLRFNVRPST
jgi:1,2-diacylglycerol 3-alpha-glucosyltransferase